MAKTKIAAKITLFFIGGPRPSEAEDAEAAEMTGQVRFRNAVKATCDGALEPFDYLAGEHIPDCYEKEARRKAGLPDSTPPVPKVEIPGPSSPLKAGGPVAAPVAPAASVWKPNA